MIRYRLVIAVTALAISWPGTSLAADYFSLLDVRYETGLKKTFLGGPFSSRNLCDELNHSVWDNVQPTCGNCKKEVQFCAAWSELNEPYQKVLKGQPAPFVYAIAAKKHRIIFSASTRVIVERECEWTAANFRANGYPDARCVR
jgi:hypothetical protein